VAFLAEVMLVVLSSGYLNNGGKITDTNNTQAANMAKNIAYVVQTKVPLVDAQGKSVATVGALGGEPNTSGHTALLGKELYSRFILPFEICSLILLVAAIGAIVMARRSLTKDRPEFSTTGISLSGGPAPGSSQESEVERELTAIKTTKPNYKLNLRK
jgi:NADH-quinone oxidoreductase subunit J